MTSNGSALSWGTYRYVVLFFVVTLIPFVIFIYRIKKGRSKNYSQYLKNVKTTRDLTNDKIDLLIQNIDNLRDNYKIQRDYILNLTVKLCKLLILPLTAVIFKTVSNDLSLILLITIFVFTSLCSFVLAIWNDFTMLEFLKGMGIKNDYLLTVVREELKYMKTL